jgi:epoxyqueuosine reductase
LDGTHGGKTVEPDLVLPGARSIIMLGVELLVRKNCSSTGCIESAAGMGTLRASRRLSRYNQAGAGRGGCALESLYGVTSHDYRYYVDTGPILERSWAARSGIGFTGKNAMLISREHGNWLFLASILTRIDFAPDEPVRNKFREREVGLLCGSCTRCLDACPTNAFAAPGVVDARRCISYQTIENKGVIPRELRAGIGNRIYGCDVCLDVCPWNRFREIWPAAASVGALRFGGSFTA